MELIEMKNIGQVLADELKEVGIKNSEDLIKVGSIGAMLRLNVSYDTCSNKLYALEGAIQGIRWHDLPSELRSELLKLYKEQRAKLDNAPKKVK